MTREEAIAILKVDGCGGCTWQSLNPCVCENKECELKEALDMAIQALSQEPTEKPMTVDEMEREYEKSKALFHKIVECDDVVSRADFESHLFENYCVPVSKIGKPNQYSSGCFYKDVVKCLDDLPSVTQMSGKWIDRQFQSKIDGEIRNGWECSECGERFFRYDLVNTDEFIPKYCPNCGRRMVEPQESEESK